MMKAGAGVAQRSLVTGPREGVCGGDRPPGAPGGRGRGLTAAQL